ncbi:hypothetical protein ABKN59_002490 [Abortiporus biennis]
MPSLRRTLSTPAARLSPYSYSSANSSSTMTRPAGGNPRRSSGSAIAERRVLADLDWWRVQEGQHDLRGYSPADFIGAAPSVTDPEHEQEQVPAADVLVDALAVTNNRTPIWNSLPGAGADAGVDDSHLSFYMSVHFSAHDTEPMTLSPLPQFSALAISERTPARRRLTVSSDDSQSSLDSTPETSILSLSPMSDMGFSDFAPIPPAADENVSPYAGLSRSSRRPTSSPFGRSVSYSTVESRLTFGREHNNRFEDIVAPPFFSNTMDEVDDLFI